tara:strand:- start:1197 stop:2201 length:1005 start_codon:yes stop_codon:yes gene_type:complete
MKNSNIVKPTGLKGNDKLNRMRELMGNAPINEGITRSVVELTKQGPDGNVYAIVRENHEYYIKVSEAKSNLVTEDFQYMGGLQNKKDKVYTSYAKAIKQLNLKFMSINEAAGKSGSFDTFKSDGLLTEHHGMNPNATLSASKAIGDGDEYVINKKGDNLKYDNKEGSNADGFGDNVAPGKAEADVEKVKLSENETAIDEMIEDEDKECKCDGDCKCRKDVVEENAPIKKGFSIARAIQEMDEVIDSIATEDDKVNDILESLGDTEKAIMMEALNKNVNEIYEDSKFEKKIHKDKHEKPAFTDKEKAELDSVVGQIDTDEVEPKESEESEVKKKD